jgi:hypothetical protein
VVSRSYDGARFWDAENRETTLGSLKLTNVEAAVDGKTLSKILLSDPLSVKPVLTWAQSMFIVDVWILKYVRMYYCIIRTATYVTVVLSYNANQSRDVNQSLGPKRKKLARSETNTISFVYMKCN